MWKGERGYLRTLSSKERNVNRRREVCEWEGCVSCEDYDIRLCVIDVKVDSH